jgi:predicted molibdopterin-dependent oxidoreductase YjgC
MCKKAIRKGAKLIFIGPEQGGLARLADVHIKCEDGEQAKLLLGLLQDPSALEDRPALKDAVAKLPQSITSRQEVKDAAAILKAALLKVVIFDKDHPGTRRQGDERMFAETAEALGATVLAMREKSNMQGLLDMGANPAWLPGYLPVHDAKALEGLEKSWCVPLHGLDGANADLAGLLRRKELKVAVVLGEDPIGDESFPKELRDGLLAVDLLIVGDLFLTPTAQRANVVLPLCSAAETSGTLTNHERRVQAIQQAIPPLAGIETWQILRRLGEAMGFRFKVNYASTAEITDEIRRVIPAYRGVKLEAVDAEGIWELSAMSLPRVAADWAKAAPPVKRLPTLGLDPMESRFERWFTEIFAKARPQAAQKTG